MHNINNTILNHAKSLGLEPCATGGGCDFMCRYFDDDGATCLVLASTEDLCFSPDTLDEPSTVAIYLNDPEWTKGTFIDFGSATDAMAFMASTINVQPSPCV